MSLIEQRRAIANYSEHHQFKIVGCFEEQATACRGGRPVFRTVLRVLGRDAGMCPKTASDIPAHHGYWTDPVVELEQRSLGN
ncbi:hypothetical protein [Roseobacter sp.]|uniref:hypothetical protein n=1 Tax=Roseobacter sp. TaxID=1907202 RepID=UPI00398FFFED